MKKLVLLLSIFGAAAFTAAAGAGGSGAERASFPFDEVVYVPCSGEYVELTGSVNFVFHSTFDAAGGQHLKIHSNLQGVSGTGMTTGVKYRGTQSDLDQFNVAEADAPFEGSTVTSEQIIGQGPGNNFVLHESAHFTINANGDLTAQHDHVSVDCK
jgi:hypothetical protein